MANEASVYRYTIELQYVKGNEATTIDAKYIKSAVIDYDYDITNMPMVFLTLSIDKNLLDDMLNNMDTALMNMTIYRYIANNDLAALNTVYIRDQFVYFLDNELNERKELDNGDETRKDNQELYKLVTMGLLKLDLLNGNKKRINGVINNTSMVNMIYYCAGHMPMLIEPLKYNSVLDQIILPPINSVAKAIAYLNKISVFYDTPYRFFMDFDTTYLLSSSGKAVPKRGEDINSIIINLRGITDIAANELGMRTDNTQKAYSFELNIGDLSSSYNKESEKSFNTISAVTTGQSLDDTNLNINNSSYIKSKSRLVRLPNDNVNLVKNIKSGLESVGLIVRLRKNDLDCSVMTINKEYMIKTNGMDPEYQMYDGRYLLIKKQDLFIRDDETFSSNTFLTLKQIPST